MFRLTKALALAAVAASGLVITNLTPALAANTTVEFRVKNTDPIESMKLAATPPSTISGYLPVGTLIGAAGYDPSASGHITFSAPLPTSSVSAPMKYESSTGASACTFTVQVSHVTGGYQLAFLSDAPSRCLVPSASPISSTGDFSATVYELDWHS